MYSQTVNSLASSPGLYGRYKKQYYAFFGISMLIFFGLFSTAQQGYAQSNDTAFQRLLNERAAKIVATLKLSDTIISNKVTQQIATQYLQLNAIHDKSKSTIANIKTRGLSKEETDAAIKAEGDKKRADLKQLHDHFIALLGKRLTAEQIDQVKDGMTYRVLPITWAAYLDMLPKLTQVQKDKMFAWLLEARELAMDEGSSDAKHAVFGKYKGKINNYLSSEGYDMKKEGEEWAKRIEASKKTKQNQN